MLYQNQNPSSLRQAKDTMRKRHRFTLIEILTVIVIISILVGITLGVAKLVRNKTQLNKTLAKMQSLEMGLENCQHDLGYYPSTTAASHDIVQLGDHFDSDDYDTLASMGSDWPLARTKFRDSQTGRPYVEGYEGGDYTDAWGRPFLYRCDGDADQHRKQTFDLFSAGPDGKPGNEDDVTNWQRN